MIKKVLALSFICSTVFADVSLIAVSGTAEKTVDPNIVNVQMEIWAKSSQAKSAQESVAKEYQRIKTVVDKFKIKKEDFQTTSYSLVPEYNYDKGSSKIVGYRVSHTILFVIRKVEDAGSFVDSIGSSAASIQSVLWDYDKREQIQVSLLAEAVKSAKAQADELAKASNTKIKGVYRITRTQEGGTYLPMRSAKMSMGGIAEMASTEMAAGPVKIQVSVSAEYEIQ